MSDSSPAQFLTIGHRGAGGEKFENSRSGFEHAIELDIDAIELDVRAAKGELWVIHDDDLDRLTGESGFFHELEDPASIRLKNGEAIPRLRDILDLCWGKMPLNIEIKSLDTAVLVNNLLCEYPTLEPNPVFPWILISSFDHRQLLQLRLEHCPWALAPAISGVPMQPNTLIEQLQPYSWHIDDKYLDVELIQNIQAHGVRVIVYTINHISFARKLKAMGIDGVFTDLPSTLRHID